MKNRILIIAITLATHLVSAQLNVSPVIGISGSMTMLDQDGILAKTISFSPGLEINKRSYFAVNFQYIKSNNKVDLLRNSNKLKGFLGSVSYMFRLLDSPSKISPMIGFESGCGFYSNSEIRSRNVAPDYNVIPAKVVEHDFDAYRFFVKGKFMLDIRLNYLSLRFGPTYSLFEARRFVFEEQKIRSKGINGLGLEIGVIFPFSKRIFSGNFQIPSRH